MNNYYVDTSTFMRAFLADAKDHKASFNLINHPQISWISSSLLRLEARRTSYMQINERGILPALLKETDNFIGNRVALYRITDLVMLDAFTFPQTIKSADAIHLATAKQLMAQIDGVVTSDKTMFRFGTELGLPMLDSNQALEAVNNSL